MSRDGKPRPARRGSARVCRLSASNRKLSRCFIVIRTRRDLQAIQDSALGRAAWPGPTRAASPEWPARRTDVAVGTQFGRPGWQKPLYPTLSTAGISSLDWVAASPPSSCAPAPSPITVTMPSRPASASSHACGLCCRKDLSGTHRYDSDLRPNCAADSGC